MNYPKMSKEQEELVLQNMSWMRDIVRYKFHISPGEREEVESIAYVELVRAAACYDASREIKFSTLAFKFIQNGIFQYLRKNNAKKIEISLDATVCQDDGGNRLTYWDIIPSAESEFTTEVEEKDLFVNCLNAILNLLERKERFAILCHISGMLRKEIVVEMGYSPSYITYLTQKASEKIKKGLTQKYEKLFQVSAIGNEYEIQIKTQNTCENNGALVEFFRKIREKNMSEDFPKFKFISRKENEIIQFPAISESFFYLAKLFDLMEEKKSK